jgi:hypothetical protein
MPSLLGRLYRRLGPGYFWLYMAFEVVSVLLVCLVFAELCAAAACRYTIYKTAALGRPVTDWPPSTSASAAR